MSKMPKNIAMSKALIRVSLAVIVAICAFFVTVIVEFKLAPTNRFSSSVELLLDSAFFTTPFVFAVLTMSIVDKIYKKLDK